MQSETADVTQVARAVDRLRAWLASGQFRKGDRLPTQVELSDSFGISRSVLREAVATLKAEGMLTSRRGAGVFVTDSISIPFRLAHGDLDKVREIVSLLELRAAVEIEAAGLAAMRRSQRQAQAVTAALERIDLEIGGDMDAIEADQAFHVAIAEASNNERFPEFLGFLRGILIPRQRVRLKADPAVGHAGYLRMLQREHRDIEAAIRVGDPVGARAAMRRHLMDGAQRYRRWAEDLQSNDSGTASAAPET